MSLLKDYARDCFLGSERKAPTAPAMQGQLQMLIENIQQSTATQEEKILRTAASLHLYSAAGFIPEVNSTSALVLCEPEDQACLDDAPQIASLDQLFTQKASDLLYPLLSHLVVKKILLHPKLLPAFFQTLINHRELRHYLEPLMGKRGRWLLAMEKNWAQSLASQESISLTDWEDGSFEQALVYIQSRRLQSPADARQLIAARLSELDARQRAQLIACLATNLSSGDEVLLESLLKDRSKEVRQLSAGLLARLPSSGFVSRASDRMQALLLEEKKLFRKTWQIAVPDNFNAVWAGDGIEEKRPQSESLGQKAWWFYQIVLCLPLDWWQEKLQMTPVELIDWAVASDWQEALLRVWQQACIREKNANWAEAFLAKGNTKVFQPDVIELVDCLTQKQKIAYWSPRLSAKHFADNRSLICTWAIKELQQDYRQYNQVSSFANEFLQALLEQLNQYVFHQQHYWDYSAKTDYLSLMSLAPLHLMIALSRLWPVDVAPNGATQELLAQAHDILRIRQMFNA